MLRSSFFILALLLLDGRVGERTGGQDDLYVVSTEHISADLQEPTYVQNEEEKQVCAALQGAQLKNIGAGSTQGTVYEIEDKTDKFPYAFKHLPDARAFKKEVNMYTLLKEANVRHTLGFHGTCHLESASKDYIILDLAKPLKGPCSQTKPQQAVLAMIEFAFDMYKNNFRDTDHGFYMYQEPDHNIFCEESAVLAYDFGYAKATTEKSAYDGLTNVVINILSAKMVAAVPDIGVVEQKLLDELAKIPNTPKKFAGVSMTPVQRFKNRLADEGFPWS